MVAEQQIVIAGYISVRGEMLHWEAYDIMGYRYDSLYELRTSAKSSAVHASEYDNVAVAGGAEEV